ncbi:MAG: bifunctional chorismate-binding protein/class IV aminotransferase [Magnetococcus sp. WYHC-3]
MAIRTLWRDAHGVTRLGLGGGIVADSRPEEEWAELAHKGRFLHEAGEATGLIETLRVTPEGRLPRAREHLARVRRGARRLGIPLDEEAALVLWQAEADRAAKGGDGVLRAQLSADGSWRLTSRRGPPPGVAARPDCGAP